MGFNRLTWSPGHERKPVGSSRFRELARLRRQREAARVKAPPPTRSRARSCRWRLCSAVRSRIPTAERRPAARRRRPLDHARGLSLRQGDRGGSGKRDVLIGARWLEASPPATVRLRSSRAYAGSVDRHPGDVALAHDVLDRQLVDAGGVQVVRPADLYLAAVEIGSSWWGSRLARGAAPADRAKASAHPPASGAGDRLGSITAFAPARADGSGIADAAPISPAMRAPGSRSTERRRGQAAEASDIQAALDEAQAKTRGDRHERGRHPCRRTVRPSRASCRAGSRPCSGCSRSSAPV